MLYCWLFCFFGVEEKNCWQITPWHWKTFYVFLGGINVKLYWKCWKMGFGNLHLVEIFQAHSAQLKWSAINFLWNDVLVLWSWIWVQTTLSSGGLLFFVFMLPAWRGFHVGWRRPQKHRLRLQKWSRRQFCSPCFWCWLQNWPRQNFLSQLMMTSCFFDNCRIFDDCRICVTSCILDIECPDVGFRASLIKILESEHVRRETWRFESKWRWK